MTDDPKLYRERAQAARAEAATAIQSEDRMRALSSAGRWEEMADRAQRVRTSATQQTTLPPRTTTQLERQWPSPLMMVFAVILLVNLLLIYLAFEVELSSPSAGGDAAGNGMSAGFTALIEYVALSIVGILALVFMLIRKRWFRLVMVTLLGLNAFALLMLVSLIHGHP
ncbi:hypothetical protein NHF48_023430 [Sphingomonas sp. H160509]|uniref:hypothetical protein n=1 Tax=Sphingomonas sp. H160509 TaxID=2955313 RepID=UPI0020975253|nr:hypothetical protein [Sphingomonas sp. H160509]MDD1453216.1 hypothetical protein [Sphingomonas sp. H160509]